MGPASMPCANAKKVLKGTRAKTPFNARCTKEKNVGFMARATVGCATATKDLKEKRATNKVLAQTIAMENNKANASKASANAVQDGTGKIVLGRPRDCARMGALVMGYVKKPPPNVTATQDGRVKIAPLEWIAPRLKTKHAVGMACASTEDVTAVRGTKILWIAARPTLAPETRKENFVAATACV